MEETNMEETINPGDIVCLTFDKSKRFLVELPFDPDHTKVLHLLYFNESKGELQQCTLDAKYFTKVK